MTLEKVSKELRNAAASGAAKSGAKIGEVRVPQMPVKTIRDFLATLDNPTEDPAMRRFSKDFLLYIKGGMTEKKMYNAVKRLLDATPISKAELEALRDASGEEVVSPKKRAAKAATTEAGGSDEE